MLRRKSPVRYAHYTSRMVSHKVPYGLVNKRIRLIGALISAAYHPVLSPPNKCRCLPVCKMKVGVVT
jgi:hypothetical protein